MKNDILFNIKFVRAIEKHEVLYNNRKTDYQNSAVIKETWEKIGQEMGETAQACKDRWKCIRTCYVRYVRLRTMKKSVRQYYLAKYLSFLLPFLKRDYGSGNNSTMVSQTDALYSEESTDGIDFEHGHVKLELVDTLFDGDSTSAELADAEETVENEVASVDGCHENDLDKPLRTASRKRKTSDPLGEDDGLFFKTPCRETVEDSDSSFLNSLLPDMRRMSDKQKFEFKMKTMQVIGDILYSNT